MPDPSTAHAKATARREQVNRWYLERYGPDPVSVLLVAALDQATDPATVAIRQSLARANDIDLRTTPPQGDTPCPTTAP